MIERIVDLSIRHKTLVFLLALAGALAGWRSMMRVPLDALPEMGDKQVIVYSRWDRSPDLVDAQVTYPIVSALLGAPHVKAVRGVSDFGTSFVYVIFEDDVDLYWARTRTLEYLSRILPGLPEGVKTEIGPDATSLGWVFQYVLTDLSGRNSLADLRSYQDWYLNFYLKSVPGVAEVAAVGGLVRQYQVNVDPNRLRSYGISMPQVVHAIKEANRETGGRVLESGGSEWIIRGMGYAHSREDLEEILLASTADGTPVRVRDVAHVVVGSDFRRGIADLDGMGEAVSGIVVMRQGENALEVIQRVKDRIRQISPSLPPGMEIRTVYDRSELIRKSIDNLRRTILEIMLTVAAIVIIFLWHPPSIVVPLVTIPISVLIAFLSFQWLGMSANIMSLAGIAIAVGTLVDASIIITEQAHTRMEEWRRGARRENPHAVLVSAIKRVARPSFFALLVIAAAFLPVLALQAEEGRLFRPLAYTKTLSMAVAALLAITLTPALCVVAARSIRFRFRPAWLCKAVNEGFNRDTGALDRNLIHRLTMRWYAPVVEWSISHKRILFISIGVLLLATVPIAGRLTTEFMPPLDEGVLLYMPTMSPGISESEAGRLLKATDRVLARFPEVEQVLGKAGRSDTATDPAPLSMFETLIVLRPVGMWRRVPTWYSSWAPEWMQTILRRITPDHISREELVRQMDQALRVPGMSNAWSMPIRGRIDMLDTGVKTPLGTKISGASVEQIQQVSMQVQSALRSITGTRAVFAEQIGKENFLDVRWNRLALANSGIRMEEAQAAVEYAIGGEDVTSLVEGRERYPVNVRYLADFRSTVDSVRRVLVSDETGKRQIPIAELADVRITSAPATLRSENGILTGYVYLDIEGDNFADYVSKADLTIRKNVQLPPGCSISWSGQYESIIRMKRRMKEIVPFTLLLVFALLYANTRSIAKASIVLLAVPFSAIGSIWFLYLLGYHISVAVWVGLIALLGVDAETGIFMLLYLDEALERAEREFRLRDISDLKEVVLEGAARRLRPKLMTVSAMFFGLVPIMWSSGAGSEIMKRIAAPMIGGIASSFVLELLIYPAIYHLWKSRTELGLPRYETFAAASNS